ncbi:uncharacterized protein IAS62_002389 [Cryptococcus decagattii]|uniref:Uncharacterized protein n=1 Tax=Cryptococcus decagattii TaxID=1859122 RepID=A0ABZ2ARD7_9TREE
MMKGSVYLLLAHINQGQGTKVKAKRKECLKKSDPATVEELLGGKTLEKYCFTEGKWKPSWAHLEFNGDVCLDDVSKKSNEGFYVPVGTILPLGASMQPMTAVKYGGYFPEGTSFSDGVFVPMHARMMNLLPQETTKPASKLSEESLCTIQQSTDEGGPGNCIRFDDNARHVMCLCVCFWMI